MTRTSRPDSGIDRRTFLGAVGSAAFLAPAAAGSVAAQSDEMAEWMDDVPNYDGEIADETGSEEVAVTVGAGDGFLYDPPAVSVDPGTTVVWEWTGEGGDHDVVDEDGTFESDLVAEAGHTFEHTFEEEETFLYGCTPHIPMGMKGAVVVGDDSASEGSDPVIEERAAESEASRTTVIGMAVAFLLVLLSPFGFWLGEEYLG